MANTDVANTDEQNNDVTALPSSKGSADMPAENMPAVDGGEIPAGTNEDGPKAFDLSNGPAPIMTDTTDETSAAPIKPEAAMPDLDAENTEVAPEVTIEAAKDTVKEPESGVESMGIKLAEPAVQHEESMVQITPDAEVDTAEMENKTNPIPEEVDHNPAMDGSTSEAAVPPTDMVMQSDMPGLEKKSHIGLYVGAAMFVILLGGGAYAYMTGMFGSGQSADQAVVAETDEAIIDGEEDILNAAADDEMMVEELGDDEMMGVESLYDESLTDEGFTDEAMMGEEGLTDEGFTDEAMMSDDSAMVDENPEDTFIEEFAAVDDTEPKRVKRTVSTETEVDAVSETVDDAVVMSDFINCGTDMSCFIAAAENCSLASVSQIVLGVDGEYSITGGDTDVCLLKTSAAGYQQECRFQHDDLMGLLNRWAVGEYSTDDYSGAVCEVL